MVDPFAEDPAATVSPGAERAAADLEARYRHLRDEAEDVAATRSRAGSADNFRAQAAQAANTAKGAAASIAEQARGRLSDIVGQQKAAGAARVSGVAKAARSAASDLDSSNPELARLVRSAAEGVDRIAADLRGREVGDVVDTIASFGRRQPVAFFGGAVLAGFLLARFFKSDAPILDEDPSGSI